MGKVIKRGSVALDDVASVEDPLESRSRGSHKVISGDKYAAKAEAQSIRERAEEEAGQIVQKAQAEAERIQKEAYEEAHQRGYDEGKAEGVGEVQEAVASLVQRAEQLEAQIVPQLKQLALAIARKILGKELEFSPEAVVDIIKQALADKARQRREISLRIHPDDMAMVRERQAELLEVLSRCKEISLQEDPDVALHGCIIETDAGTIDAQIETQLEVFERVLQDVR